MHITRPRDAHAPLSPGKNPRLPAELGGAAPRPPRGGFGISRFLNSMWPTWCRHVLTGAGALAVEISVLSLFPCVRFRILGWASSGGLGPVFWPLTVPHYCFLACSLCP